MERPKTNGGLCGALQAFVGVGHGGPDRRAVARAEDMCHGPSVCPRPDLAVTISALCGTGARGLHWDDDDDAPPPPRLVCWQVTAINTMLSAMAPCADSNQSALFQTDLRFHVEALAQSLVHERLAGDSNTFQTPGQAALSERYAPLLQQCRGQVLRLPAYSLTISESPTRGIPPGCVVLHCIVLCCVVWCCVRQGVWCGVVGRGVAWRGVALGGVGWGGVGWGDVA